MSRGEIAKEQILIPAQVWIFEYSLAMSVLSQKLGEPRMTYPCGLGGHALLSCVPQKLLSHFYALFLVKSRLMTEYPMPRDYRKTKAPTIEDEL